MTIGVQLSNRDGRELVETIRRAEELGVAAAWTPQGGVIPDTMLLLSAAAMVTSRIKLGTSIIPTWPRAPILIAQQAMAMHALAPGRFRLGIGPSTPAAMVPLYGADYRKPLTQLREYLTVIRAFLHEGAVDFKGEFVSARVRLRETDRRAGDGLGAEPGRVSSLRRVRRRRDQLDVPLGLPARRRVAGAARRGAQRRAASHHR